MCVCVHVCVCVLKLLIEWNNIGPHYIECIICINIKQYCSESQILIKKKGFVMKLLLFLLSGGQGQI